MKKFLFIALSFLVLNSTLTAQKSETIRVKGAAAKLFFARGELKYPSFTRAKIYFNNGEPASARINYDYFAENVKYIGEKNDTLLIENASDIKYITADLDSFFYDNKWYEWVASSATARLAQRITYKLISEDVVGAYGTSSPALKVESKSAILSGNHFDLDENKEYTFKKETTYYISPNDKTHFMIANARNIDKVFSKKNVGNYVAQNKLNLNNIDNLLDAFVFANKP